MLTNAELADMAGTQGDTFVATCVIKGMVRVNDGGGGSTATPQTVGTVPCRYAATQLARGEEIFANQLQGSVPYEVTLPIGTSVDLAHWYEVDGHIFDAMAVRYRTYHTAMRVLCRKR